MEPTLHNVERAPRLIVPYEETGEEALPNPPRASDEDERVLPGLLEEFRIALRDEIEAARRSAASGAVPLINGRRIAQVGGAHQYAFSAESALQLPEDSPGDLRVPGHPPVEATVVSVEGMSLTISVPTSFGDFIPRAALQSNLVYLLRKLIERIESVADQQNTVGERLLGRSPTSGAPVHVNTELDDAQTAAVRSALGRDTTFIWGPPGTGKTRTIGTIGVELVRRDRTLLLVSHTNAAVDQAILHIADALGDEAVDGAILRLGEPREHRLVERPRLLAKTHIEERSAALAERKKELQNERVAATEHVMSLEKELGLVEWVSAAASDIREFWQKVQEVETIEAERDRARAILLQLREQRPHQEAVQKAAETVLRATATLPDVETEVASVAQLMDELASARLTGQQEHAAAVALLNETQATSALMRRWRGLPKPEEQQLKVSESKARLDALDSRLRAAGEDHARAQQEVTRQRGELARFRTEYEMSPEEGVAQLQTLLEQIRLHENEEVQLRLRAGRARADLQRRLDDALSILREFALTSMETGTLEELIAELQRVYSEAADRTQRTSATELRQELAATNARIIAMNGEIERIDEMLRQVEMAVIADATVVATTLTRAYLRDSVQNRRFDTVILDEASMAPIPALWLAAALADKNAVVVGDFRQLPPIKHSDHEYAEKWLGRDIFDASSVRAAYDSGAAPEHLVQLTVQYRMHPKISDIPNRFVYEGRLRNGRSAWDENELQDWYNLAWSHDAPVLLVNMASAHAWVTSVAAGGRASRLNFLSATVCMDIVQQLLSRDRVQLELGDRHRILLGTPYRPQARLLNLLIKHQSLEREVVAGTAHTFQGNEAPIMIFDFVNDEPHWRVGMFNPSFDETTKRLLNVALTRAQHRLVLVGDFDWIQRNSRRAFLGQLVSWLKETHPVVDAVNILPTGLAARAADAQSATVRRVERSPDAHLLVDQDAFYEYLMADISAAERRLVMYSPFITRDRLAIMGSQLQAAAERGVSVYVVTKTRQERGQREQSTYSDLEDALEKWSVTVIHKQRMHEKLVFIDDRIVWTGSLNPLSFSNTQEVMERRISRELVKEYARVLRLEDLLVVYDTGQNECPICGSELVPAEGRDEPFYWRCIEEDCYTRGIDQPAPRDGEIVCANCGESVTFGYWGDEPRWRCTVNPRHRQRIGRTHLRLPKMRDIIPKRELRKLERVLGIDRQRPPADA